MTAVYASARQQGLTEEMIHALPHFQDSDLFTPREKAALRFADTLARDHKQVSQDLFDELRDPLQRARDHGLGLAHGDFYRLWAAGLRRWTRRSGQTVSALVRA